MEQIPNQAIINEQRERFLEKAEALAEAYEVSLGHVMEIFASSEGKHVEKHLENKELLEKLFTEDEFRDDARWEMVEEKLKLEQSNLTLEETKDALDETKSTLGKTKSALDETKIKLEETDQKLQESERDALEDPLTSLYNRGALYHALTRRAEIFKRDAFTGKQKPFSFIFIDLDNFKQINDVFGHLTGDAVLKTVSRKITERIRSADLAGRFGGEEFCILFEGDIKKAQLSAERIRQDIAMIDEESLRALGFNLNVRKNITASIGVSEFVYNGDIKEDLDSMISRADAAMYEAKHAGKNQVKVAPLIQRQDQE